MPNILQSFFEDVKALPDYVRLKVEQANRPQPKMEFKVGEGVPQQPSPLRSIEQRITQNRPAPKKDPITELVRTTVEPILGPIVQKFSPQQGTIETPVGTIETPKLKIERKIEEGKSPLRAQLEVGGELAFGIASITPFGRGAKILGRGAKILSKAEKELDFLAQEAQKYKSAAKIQEALPTAQIKKGSIYPNDLSVDFPEGGTLHYQELPDSIVIRAVSNKGIGGVGSVESKGVATKAVRTLMNYAADSGKSVEVTGIHNRGYWETLGFPPAKDFTTKLDSPALLKKYSFPKELQPLVEHAQKSKTFDDFISKFKEKAGNFCIEL